MANCVVIADDENLDIAREHGFLTIEMSNDALGAKVNAGFEFAAQQGADYLTFIGSDDWVHADYFLPLQEAGGCVIASRGMTLVDLDRSVMTTFRGDRIIPWLIPASELWPCSFRPVDEHFNKGLDWSLYMRLREAQWVMANPHPHVVVDFKSGTNITPYSSIGRSIGTTPEQPLTSLREWYPAALVDLAEEIA